MKELKESIRQQIIGEKIVKVTYFELNDPDQPFYYDDFDNFDLGIEIAFSNGFHWHIGWKDNDYHEAGEGKYLPIDRLYPHKRIDATNRWASYVHSTITDFELSFVDENWKIPAKCSIHFNDSESIIILLGEELNVDGSVPQPLNFCGCVEIYVFHGRQLPSTELVEIITPTHLSQASLGKNHIGNTPQHDSISEMKSTNFVALLIIFIVVCLFIIKLTLKN